MAATNSPEMIDIYDENRNKTGLLLPRKTKLEKGQYMLYVLALIEDADHRFLVTQRAMDKKWAAGHWEIPGGGAMAGESSFEALCREVKEETGLDLSKCEPNVAYSYCNEDLKSGDNYFADIYRIQLDFTLEDVKVDAREAIDVKLASAEEIQALQEKIGFLHYARICKALGLENQTYK